MMAVDPKVLKEIQDETFTASNPLPTARAINPAVAGRAVKAHRATGVDDLLYAENIPQMDEIDDQAMWDKVVADSPRTARFLAEKQTYAAMGRDDVQNLQSAESLFPKFSKIMPQGYSVVDPRKTYRADPTAAPFAETPSSELPSSVLTRSVRSLGRFAADVPAAFNYSVGLAAETVAPLTDWTSGRLFPENPLRRVAAGFKDLAKAGRATAEAIQGELPQDAGILERNWYGAVRSTGQQLPFLAATIATRNPSYALAGAGLMGGAEAGMTGQEQGASTAKQLQLFLGSGAAEVAFESNPITKLLGDIKVGSSFGRMLAGQIVREVPGELATTAVQNLNEFAVLRPDEPLSNYFAELPAASRDTIISTVMQSVLMSGVGRGISMAQKKADKAESGAVLLESLDKLSQASKVRSLDTTTFENFIADVASGTPAENIYIDGKILNQSGIAAELSRAVPELAEDIQLAIESGGTLKIPTATFAGRIAGTEISQVVLENARTDPLGFSPIEAREFYDTQAEAVKDEIERAANVKASEDAFSDEQKQVRAAIKDQLDSTGKFTPEANDLYAMLISSRVATRARQLGISPMQMMQESPLSVIAAKTQPDGRIMNQSEADRFLSMFDDANVEEITIEAPEGEDDATRFLSPFKARGAFTYTGEESQLLERVRQSSALASDELRGKIEAGRVVEKPVGPFSAYRIAGEITDPDSFNPNGTLRVDVFGKEQIDAGLTDEPALSFVVTPDGELTVNGPTGATFDAFKQNGWATEAVGKDGEAQIGWTALTSKNGGPMSTRELVPLLADVHARAKIWKGNPEKIGLHWTRQTGATGGLLGRETAVFFQDGDQQTRGAFVADKNIIALLENADLSTFLHESAHWFYETDIAMASQFIQQESRTPGEQEIVDDVSTLLSWHGIMGTPQQQLDQWHAMPFEQQRAMHERTAETFEAYLYTGKAPTIELQKAFSTFRQWLLDVYKSARDFLQSRNKELSEEVRGVFDRMLATQEQIDMANAARSMVNLIESADQVGMTQEEFAKYQELAGEATDAAIRDLEARSLRDMKYQASARSKEIKKLKAEQKAVRDEITMQVRGEVMAMPIYRAWSFLTGRIREQDQIPREEKSPRDSVDAKQDSLFTAIAKLGGLNRADVKSQWGVTDKISAPVFGKPVLRKTQGRSLDDMARALGELGYLTPDKNGKVDVRELEEKFLEENGGNAQYSVLYVVPEEARPVDDMGGGRFNESDLQSLDVSKTDIQFAVERKMTSKAGFHPDFIAELFGFDSGAQLVAELGNADSPQYMIEKIVDARMLMNYGDLATDEAIEEAADRALMNKVRARHVVTEHNALANATGGARILEKAAQELADKIISAKKVKDIKPKEYTAAAAKAAASAQKAMRAGDLKQAAEDSRARVIQTVTAKAAYDAKEEIETIDAFFKKVLSGDSDKLAKTRDMDMVNAARALLAEFGYGRAGQDPQGYLKILERQDPVSYQAVIGSVVAAKAMGVTSIQDMTLEDLRRVHDEVQSIWYLSRRSRQIEIEGDKMDRADIEDALVARLEEIGPITSEVGKGSAITEKEVMALNMGSVKSALTRVENWVSMLDGANKFGPFRRYFYQPIKDAADKYLEAKGNTLKSFRGLFDQIMPDMKKGLIKADELGYTFGKDSGGVAMNEILHAILHTGNESNKRKLLLGRVDKNNVPWGKENADGTLDSSRWDAFIARMIREGVIRKEHFDFAQAVWDLLDGTKVKAQDAYRNAYGKYFDEVSANEFTTPFGTYRGGYVPAKIDSRIVMDNELRDLIEAGKEGMAYAFPSTAKGFTKSRVEYNKPLLLDLRLLSQHIDSVLLFSYMENPIRDAAKVMSRGKVNMALNAQQPGMISGAVIPFLNRAGRQQVTTPVAGASWVMRKLNQLRANVGLSSMFANVSNAAQQVSGFALASVKVKPSLMLSAAADYMASPKKTAAEVAELSVYMRNRMDGEVNAMRGEIEQILIDPNLYEKTQAWFQRHGYFMQSAVDNVMGPIIWKAAFTQYQEEGFSDKDSIRLADSVIRTTQGSTLPEDVSRMETGPAYARLLTQFVGYFNMQANLLGSEFGKIAQEGGLRKNMGKGFYLLIAGFLAPAIVAEAIAQAFRGGPSDDDKDGEYLDDWLMALFVYGPMRNATAFAPFVGQALNSAVARFNGNPTDDKVSVAPVVGAIEGSMGVMFDLYSEAIGKGNSDKTIKDVSTLISMTTGIPLTAAAKPVRYLIGQEEGKITPTSAGDAARGLLTGAASPESRNR